MARSEAVSDALEDQAPMAPADAMPAPIGLDADALEERHGTLAAIDILKLTTSELFAGKLALVSSFGAESAVLLHMVAGIDPFLPVIFLDTEKLFAETLAYRDRLVSLLALRDVRTVRPNPARLALSDPSSDLVERDRDRCCAIRKVEPLALALEGFTASISGRKRFQGGRRGALRVFENDDDGRIKINPLAHWSAQDLKAYILAHDLPRHPLVADGYLSIGCIPCTDRVRAGEDSRAGRWRGSEKTECGIHLPAADLHGDSRRSRVPLIKDGAYVEDGWLRIGGEAPLPTA